MINSSNCTFFQLHLFIKVVLANYYVSIDKLFSDSHSMVLTVSVFVICTLNLEVWEYVPK